MRFENCLKILNSFGKEVGHLEVSFELWSHRKTQDFTHRLQLKGEDFASSRGGGGGGGSQPFLVRFSLFIVNSSQQANFPFQQKPKRAKTEFKTSELKAILKKIIGACTLAIPPNEELAHNEKHQITPFKGFQ